jgi:hypothetical protein
MRKAVFLRRCSMMQLVQLSVGQALGLRQDNPQEQHRDNPRELREGRLFAGLRLNRRSAVLEKRQESG